MKTKAFAGILLSVFTFSLFAAKITVPAKTSEVTASFKAGKKKITINYFWADGTRKNISIAPGDVKYLVNSNSGKRIVMKDAGYFFKGLEITDFVRPNIALLRSALLQDAQQKYAKLPPLQAKDYCLKLVNTPEGGVFYINGNYAGIVPYKSKKISFLSRIETSLTAKNFQFSRKEYNEKYHVLTLPGKGFGGKFEKGTVTYDGGKKIPFGKVTSANMALSLTAKQFRLYPNTYGDSGQTGRNAFDHAEASFLFTIPAKQYAFAHILCVADDNPFYFPSFTARLTRYVPSGAMGGRAYSALGDTRMDVDKEKAEKVGTVKLGKKVYPLWYIKVPLNTGKVIDLITDPYGKWGRGAFPMHYMDFELMGKNPLYRTPFGDPRAWPDPDKISSIHVFGAVLERSGMDVRFIQTTKGRNVFDDKDVPAMKVSYKRNYPGKYELSWKIFDHRDTLLREDSCILEGEKGEKNIDLAMKKLGWYKIVYTLKNLNSNEQLLTHEGSFALMGKDTRKAAWESPYIGWARLYTHYGPGTRLPGVEVEAVRTKMAGIRRLTTLGGYSEKEFWGKYMVTSVIGGWSNRRTSKLSDEKYIELIRKNLEKYPNARQVPLAWEDTAPFGVYAEAPELFGEKVPPYDANRQKHADRRWNDVMRAYKIIPKHFPQLKILYGNSATCSELIAEVLRRKPPKDFAHYLGTEAIQRTAHPEKPNIPFTMMYAWQQNRLAQIMGYGHLKVTCGPENIARKVDTLGAHTVAEWIVRDMLVQHVFQFDDIAGCDTSLSRGNSYDTSFYGQGNNRAPYFYPMPPYTATATLTRILDCVKFQKMFPTGSDTVYCAEFYRSYDKKYIYVFWTSRGDASLKIKTNSSNVEHVEFHGASSFPSIWFKSMKLTAGEEAQYLLCDAPLRSVTVSGRTFKEDPEVKMADFTLLDPLNNSTVKWKVDHKSVPEVDKDKKLHRVISKTATVKAMEDPHKGKCLQLTIPTDKKLNEFFTEYMVIRPEKPIPIKDEVHTIGMWVKGNSGWGQVWWELEDANGVRRISSSTLVHGGDVADYPGRVSINFDSWCFLSTQVTSRSPIRELSTGSVKNIWSGPWGDMAMPCKLTGIYFAAPVKAIHLNSSKYMDQTICVKDVSVITEKKAVRSSFDAYAASILIFGEERHHKALMRKGAEKSWYFGFYNRRHIKQKTPGENGFVFPFLETIIRDRYNVVFVPHGEITKSSMNNMKEYVANGGIVILGYTAMGRCFDKNPKFVREVAGIRKFQALHSIPYTQKVALEHELHYLPVMQKKFSWKNKAVYATTAKELAGAIPLIECGGKEKGLYAATVFSYGKGKMIFYGFSDKTPLADLLEFVLRQVDKSAGKTK